MPGSSPSDCGRLRLRQISHRVELGLACAVVGQGASWRQQERGLVVFEGEPNFFGFPIKFHAQRSHSLVERIGVSRIWLDSNHNVVCVTFYEGMVVGFVGGSTLKLFFD